MAKAQRAGAATARDRYDASVIELTAETLLHAQIASAPIDFQHHRSGVAFRNIRIRRLS